MTESRNPFESPGIASAPSTIAKPVVQEVDFDLRGMLWLIGTVVLIVAAECLFVGGLGPILLLAPPTLFFVVAVWSVIAGTRHGSKPMWLRIVLGLLVGVLAVPSFQFLLMVTCIPAVETVGAGWNPNLKIGNPARIPFTFVSTSLVALFGLLLFGLAYLTPKALRKPQLPRSESNSKA